MKKLAGLVIILAVLVLGGYYGMGVFTEKTIKKNMDIINHSNGLYVDIQDYKRGWFCSEAQLKWKLHVPERMVKEADGRSQIVPSQDYRMEMPIKIHHGPFIFANKQLRFGMGYAESDIQLPKQYSEQFETMFSKDSIKPQIELSIFVSYLNNSTLGLNLPHFKLIAKDGSSEFDWQGMKSKTSVSSSIDKVGGHFNIEGATFNKDDNKIVLGHVSSQYRLHETMGGLYLGDASFALPSFVVTIKEQKMFEIKELSINSSSDIEDNLFNTSLKISLDSVFANNQTYGSADLEVSLKKLDAEVLARINQQANAMQNGTDAERQKAMLALLPELPKLFSKGAQFEISKLSVKIPQGAMDGHLFVSLPEGDLANPFEIFQKIKGNAKLKVPKALVNLIMQQSLMQQMNSQPDMQQTLLKQLQESGPAQANQPALTAEQIAAMQTDKQLDSMQKSGLVTIDGDDYLIEVNLEQGKLMVNGKSFDSSMMKF